MLRYVPRGRVGVPVYLVPSEEHILPSNKQTNNECMGVHNNTSKLPVPSKPPRGRGQEQSLCRGLPSKAFHRALLHWSRRKRPLLAQEETHVKKLR